MYPMIPAHTRGRLLAAALFLGAPLAWGAGAVTAVNGGTHPWSEAPWTAGAPSAEATVFINDNAHLTIDDRGTALAQGVRIGNNTTATSRLTIESGVFGTTFIVVGDAANANGEFTQTGGALTIQNTRFLDFEVGNPQNASTETCTAVAVFSGGEANLADVRLNVRPFREVKMSVVGSAPRIQAASLSADPGSSTSSWTVGVLEFVLDGRGVAPLAVLGELKLGEGMVDLIVEGRAYQGREKRIPLIQAAVITGRFHNTEIKGLPAGARVAVEGNKVVLVQH